MSQLSALISDDRVREVIPDFDGAKMSSFQEEIRTSESNYASRVFQELRVPLEQGVPDSIPEELIIRVKPIPRQHILEELQGGNYNE